MFPGFLGNDRIVKSLLRAIEAKSISHALLFVGPQGSGRKTLAAKVANRLFCPSMCGKCKNCSMLAKGVHPDYKSVFPQGSTLKIEQSRYVKDFLSTPPNTAPYKIAVLDNCENLTVEAGNSLLKIIEEPPPASICIMLADTAENVLPTIVSRSQIYTLAPLPKPLIVNALLERELPQAQADFLAVLSQGVLGTALALQEDQDFLQRREELAGEIVGILTRHRDPLASSEKWHQDSEKVLDFLEAWLRDILIMQAGQGIGRPVNSDLTDKLKECMACCPLEKTVVLLEECALARQHLAARCNPQSVYDSLALKMWEV